MDHQEFSLDVFVEFFKYSQVTGIVLEFNHFAWEVVVLCVDPIGLQSQVMLSIFVQALDRQPQYFNQSFNISKRTRQA